MSFDPTKTGPLEARLSAIRSLIQGKIVDLNTVIARDSVTSGLLGNGYPSALDGNLCVTIGDPDTTWDAKVDGKVRITVCAGDSKTGISQEAAFEYVDLGAKVLVIKTSVYLYLHPDAIRTVDIKTQSVNRELGLERLADWLSAVFNDGVYSPDGLRIVLASTQFGSPDVLTECRIGELYSGYFPKSSGSEMLYGLHGVHSAKIM